MKQLTWIAAWDFVCWSTRFLSDVGDTKHERRKINNNYVHHLKSYIIKWDFRQCPNFSAKFFQRLALQSWFTGLEDTALNYLVINLERFSIESRKTKTKVIAMSNQKEAKQEHCLKRGKTQATRSWLVLVLHLIGWESGASFLNQSQSEIRKNLSNPGLL